MGNINGFGHKVCSGRMARTDRYLATFPQLCRQAGIAYTLAAILEEFQLLRLVYTFTLFVGSA